MSASHSKAPGRRYSQRSLHSQQAIPNTSRLRRIRSLFWENDKLYSSNPDELYNKDSIALESITDINQHDQIPLACVTSETDSLHIVSLGRLKLRQIHSSPHVYLVDDFLTHNELKFFYTRILAAESKEHFERSFLDEDESSLDKETCPTNDINTATKNDNVIVTNTDDSSNTSPDNPSLLSTDHQNKIESISTIKKSLKRTRTRLTLNQQRTSTFIHFTKMATKTISTIESRTSELFHLPHHCVEPIQLVKYTPGQYFNVHHDLGVMTVDETENNLEANWDLNIKSLHVTLPPRPNALSPPRRLVTVLVYLNDLPSICCTCFSKETNTPSTPYDHAASCVRCVEVVGGSTFFPLLNQGRGLRVAPKQGQALIWCNITRDGLPDTRLVHAGEAIHMKTRDTCSEEGYHTDSTDSTRYEAWERSNMFPIKYALNIWVCEE